MELEVESDKLRQRAKTLDDDLLRLRSESELKVNEYKRQASAGTSDGAAELMSSQLLEKEQELSTLNQRYAYLHPGLGNMSTQNCFIKTDCRGHLYPIIP